MLWMFCICFALLASNLSCLAVSLAASSSARFSSLFLFSHSLKALLHSSVLGKNVIPSSCRLKISICFSFMCSWCFFLSHNLNASSGFLFLSYLNKTYAQGSSLNNLHVNCTLIILELCWHLPLTLDKLIAYGRFLTCHGINTRASIESSML